MSSFAITPDHLKQWTDYSVQYLQEHKDDTVVSSLSQLSEDALFKLGSTLITSVGDKMGLPTSAIYKVVTATLHVVLQNNTSIEDEIRGDLHSFIESHVIQACTAAGIVPSTTLGVEEVAVIERNPIVACGCSIFAKLAAFMTWLTSLFKRS